MSELCHVIHFDRPIADVYDYVTTWRNWPEWYPSTRAVEGDVDHPARCGDRATERVRKLGIDGTLRWNVVLAEPPHRFVMETTSFKMAPFPATVRFRIDYTFQVDAPARTRMLRVWNYTTPGWLLQVFDRIHLRRALTRDSNRALARLRELVEAQPALQPRPEVATVGAG